MSERGEKKKHIIKISEFVHCFQSHQTSWAKECLLVSYAARGLGIVSLYIGEASPSVSCLRKTPVFTLTHLLLFIHVLPQAGISQLKKCSVLCRNRRLLVVLRKVSGGPLTVLCLLAKVSSSQSPARHGVGVGRDGEWGVTHFLAIPNKAGCWHHLGNTGCRWAG